MKKWLGVLLIIFLFIAGLVGGVVYWTYQKGKKVADSVLNTAKNTQSILTLYPSSSPAKTPAAALTIPSTETKGQDLQDVPRFGGSIRSDYDTANNNTNIEYTAKASSKDIISFYKETLPTQGWTLYAEDQGALSFSKPDASVLIEVLDEDKTANITQYKIHYFITQSTQ